MRKFRYIVPYVGEVIVSLSEMLEDYGQVLDTLRPKHLDPLTVQEKIEQFLWTHNAEEIVEH